MSHWNHRVVKQKLEDGSEWFSVREVFYNDDGSIYAYTESPVDISGESIEAMKEYCQWILNCLDKDILVDGEVTFVDDDAAQQSVQADGGEVLPPHKHTYIDGYCACGVSITRRR